MIQRDNTHDTPDLDALKWEIDYNGRPLRATVPSDNQLCLAAAFLAILLGTLVALAIRWAI